MTAHRPIRSRRPLRRLPRRRGLARIGVVLAAVLALLAVTGSAGAASRASHVRALSATLVTGVGTFTLSGSVNIVVPSNPIVPSNPVRATLANTSATSGDLTCRATGTASHTPAAGETSVDFTGTYRFTPVDPCDPLGDLRVGFTITYDEAGDPVTVTAQVLTVT